MARPCSRCSCTRPAPPDGEELPGRRGWRRASPQAAPAGVAAKTIGWLARPLRPAGGVWSPLMCARPSRQSPWPARSTLLRSLRRLREAGSRQDADHLRFPVAGSRFARSWNHHHRSVACPGTRCAASLRDRTSKVALRSTPVASRGDYDAAGRVNEKVLPWPGALSTQIRPPWASTTSLQKVRPRPLPVLRWLPAWPNLAKIFS